MNWAHRVLCSLLLPLSSAACASVQSKAIGPKTWLLRCESSLAGCADRAKNLCRDSGFHVVRGHSFSFLSGVEGNQVETSEHEMVIRCGPPPEQTRRVDDSAVPGGDREQNDSERVRELLGTQCVPGETRECVGAAACHGGQACLEAGTGFGTCDCGPDASAGSGRDPAPEADSTTASTTQEETGASSPSPAAPTQPAGRANGGSSATPKLPPAPQ